MGELTLSEEQLVLWADAKAEALAEVARRRKEADSYSEKIRAFLTLAGEDLDNKTLVWAKGIAAAQSVSDITEAKTAAEKAGPSLIDSIHRVLAEASEPLSSAEIREALPSVGYEEPVTSATGYFYTAIKRLVDRGMISREGDRLKANNS